jgi:peptide/nickel transport system permease protein
VFLLLHAARADRWRSICRIRTSGRRTSSGLRRALGLDRPLVGAVLVVAGRVRARRLGLQLQRRARAVASRIAERVPATLELVGVAIIGALALTLPAGVYSAARRGRWIDRVVSAAAMTGISLPAFWFGLLLQIVVHDRARLLPSSGRATPGSGDLVDRLQHLVMPATVLAVVQAASWSRYLRGSMIETLAQPFIAGGAGARSHRTARAAPPRPAQRARPAARGGDGRRGAHWCRARSSPRASSRGPASAACSPKRWRAATTTVLMALLMLTSTAVVRAERRGRCRRTRWSIRA